MKILITGAAGFIGFNFAKFLLEKNIKIIGIDNLNDYYSKKLKRDRLKILTPPRFASLRRDNIVDGKGYR